MRGQGPPQVAQGFRGASIGETLRFAFREWTREPLFDQLRAALTLAQIPEWLFDASYDAVGDLAETIALVLPPATGDDGRGLAEWVESELAPLAGLSSPVVQSRLAASWSRLDREGRFVFTKLATGAFRVGVARQLVVRGLAEAYDVPVADVAQRLVGDWPPNAHFREIVRGEHAASAALTHRPYPFFLAHPLEREPASLGDRDAWQAEWKWDGIRAQLLTRDDGPSLWSRGEELVSDSFPEMLAAARALPADLAIDEEPDDQRERADQRPRSASPQQDDSALLDNVEAFKGTEKQRILAALKDANWNRAKAAEALGMPRRTFYRRLGEYKIL